MDNPYKDNPHYKPTGQWVNGEKYHPIEVHTQDVKSEEVTTDEPKKRRGSRKKARDTETKPTESDTERIEQVEDDERSSLSARTEE